MLSSLAWDALVLLVRLLFRQHASNGVGVFLLAGTWIGLFVAATTGIMDCDAMRYYLVFQFHSTAADKAARQTFLSELSFLLAWL